MNVEEHADPVARAVLVVEADLVQISVEHTEQFDGTRHFTLEFSVPVIRLQNFSVIAEQKEQGGDQSQSSVRSAVIAPPPISL